MTPSEAQLDMQSYYSDLYKEVHGIRPRWMLPEDYTVEEWQAQVDRLLEWGADQIRREEAEEATHALWVAEITAGHPLRVRLEAFMAR